MMRSQTDGNNALPDGFRPASTTCPHSGYLKKIYDNRVVATPEGVFLQVRDRVQIGKISVIRMGRCPYHRIFAITMSDSEELAAEEVPPSHYNKPLLVAEQIVRTTYAALVDSMPQFQALP